MIIHLSFCGMNSKQDTSKSYLYNVRYNKHYPQENCITGLTHWELVIQQILNSLTNSNPFEKATKF